MNPAASQRFVVLDSFRGLCAVSVVLFHIHLWQSVAEWSFFRSAGLLVEFFFVLSGFVLAHRYHDKAMNGAGLRDFMISRTCRIFPLHLATLLLMCALIVLTPLLDQARLSDLPDMVLDGDLIVQLRYNALLLQGWLPEAELFAFNGPSWSISVEYYIYVVFGLIVLLARRRTTAAMLLMVFLCSLASFLLAPKLAHSPGLRGLNCFFIGAAMYAAHVKTREFVPSRRWMNALEILTLIALYFMITLNYPQKSYWASWGFAAAIGVFALERGVISDYLKRPVFVALGEWSYSIYLMHFIVLFMLNVLLARFIPEWQLQGEKALYIHTGSALSNHLLLLATLGVVLSCARLSFIWIEKPGMRLGKYWQNRRQRAALKLAYSSNSRSF
ncbi:acyltransferase family protein [Chitinibacter sp. S2-10]|uniref:acyltransferase family protein n=1 Tax=Chitinibacter sp. S2-10 TaxID=3373597 RepID=UPI003977B910